ncbi:MAG TPA: hypothetical protein VGP07_07355 [Polyangia bacterium]|jgi:hypothetical protein
MNRLLSQVPRMPRWMPRWRHLRWVACAAVVPALWACNARRLATPTPIPSVVDSRSFKQSVNHKLDLLVMVDDSSSMAPLQTKLSAQLPTFLDTLKDSTTGQYPDLHVAVVSSSFGGGNWGNVNQCASHAHAGDDEAKFQQGPGGAGAGNCAMLNSGETYLVNGDGTSANPANFTGTIGAAFQCMALLGDTGCGFESQFESVYYALVKASMPKGTGDGQDPDNGGFLRPDAVLAVVMLTNEDDCSVAYNSLLLDPGINSAMDPSGLGALQSYRCNEFGHVCDDPDGGPNKVPPPHGFDLTMNPPMQNLATGSYRTPAGPGAGGGVTLKNCVSEEGMGKTESIPYPPMASADLVGKPDQTSGHLFPKVSDLHNLLLQLKPNNTDDILVAAIAGPVAADNGDSLYRVFAQANPAAGGELDPVIDHSCSQMTSGDPEYADPAVRVKQWIDGFGANGIFYPICADTFSKAITGIADKIHEKLGASCVSTMIAADPDDPNKHNCTVTQKTTDSTTNKVSSMTIPECDSSNTFPCYKLTFGSGTCKDPTASTLFAVCNDASCMAASASSDMKDAAISCAVM